MHFSKSLPFASAFLLTAMPLALADDIDAEDIPKACKAICEPIRTLTRQCDVDDDRVGGDRNEDLLERQCICTNDSFDVGHIAGLCQSCMEQTRDCGDSDDDDDDDCDDGREDIGNIMRACGFSSVSYDSAATSSAQSITVSASKATDISQLTTTVSPEETGVLGVGDSGSNGGNESQNNDDDSGAAQTFPSMAAYVAGAAVAGAMLLQ